jgi:hypothetical protein
MNMWRVAAGAVIATAAVAMSAAPAMAAGPTGSMPYTCAGGDIPSGTYASITVTGFCDVPDGGVVTVVGNINVAPGAVLDAQSAPSTITVGHNVTAAAGSLLGLGCQPDFPHNTGHPCVVDPTGSSVVTVDGNITSTDANTVLLNGITVNGNVTLTGGGGDIPWSIKNDAISGNVTISNVTADWLGVLFNHIARNVTLTNITATDPGDPGRKVFVVRNTIGWNLNCTGLAPGVSGGFFPGEVNTVGRNATGQCASLV